METCELLVIPETFSCKASHFKESKKGGRWPPEKALFIYNKGPDSGQHEEFNHGTGVLTGGIKRTYYKIIHRGFCQLPFHGIGVYSKPHIGRR
jgi:hypothetical protein